MKESKRILVTGGLGFIGSHLCLRLLKEGHRVLCLDDLSTGRRENLRDLESFPGFEYRNWDIIRPFFPDGPIDEIYNLACPASPAHYQKDPVKTLLTSVAGMRNMLELARTHRCRILQASTSEVYGDPWSIRSGNPTMAMSALPAPAPATTRASVAPRPSAWTTTACTVCR